MAGRLAEVVTSNCHNVDLISYAVRLPLPCCGCNNQSDSTHDVWKFPFKLPHSHW